LAFGADTKHIRAKTLTSEPAKELIERFHGSLKSRTKVMRGLKSKETANEILKIDSKAARWIASDAIKELTSDKVKQRLVK
ncbi:MAG: hypothetical protein V1645_01080, partial [archaeon]